MRQSEPRYSKASTLSKFPSKSNMLPGLVTQPFPPAPHSPPLPSLTLISSLDTLTHQVGQWREVHTDGEDTAEEAQLLKPGLSVGHQEPKVAKTQEEDPEQGCGL